VGSAQSYDGPPYRMIGRIPPSPLCEERIKESPDKSRDLSGDS